MRVWRSALFVPAHDAAKIEKAARSDADAVILDLEDGVALEAKAAARAAIAPAARLLSGAGIDVIVRIDTGRSPADDLAASIVPGVAALMIPKVEAPVDLSLIGERIDAVARHAGIAAAIDLIALIESPLALARIDTIAAQARIGALALGSEDFALQMGVEPTAELLDLPCRLLALAARARGKQALAMPLSIASFRDEEQWRAAARQARLYGASGALCIHPRQIGGANEAFAPSPAALAHAHAVLDAWEAAGARGEAVASLNGQMIDRPVVERARRLCGVAGSRRA